MTYLLPARTVLYGMAIASLILACMTAGTAAAAPATSGWSTDAVPKEPPSKGNPILCQSFEKGIKQRLETMRKLRFGSAKAPPLMPQDLTEWHKKTHMDPDVAKNYEAEEAMVKRLNGYMIDNGCQPVDIDAELGQGPVKSKAQKH